MATTKLWHISGRIEDVIDYAENPEKTCPIPDLEDLWNAARYAERPEATADGQFVTAINCTRETAVQQMILTKQQFRKTDGYIAWHGYQSFKPGEISSELCHYIRADAVEQIVMLELGRLASYLRHDEEDFAALLAQKTNQEMIAERKQAEADLQKATIRSEMLVHLFEKLYEDNVAGKVTDEWFLQLSHKYEVERLELKEKISALHAKLAALDEQSQNSDAFLAAIRKFMEMKTLTAPLLQELIDHIDVYEAQGSGKSRTQRIVIYYRFVGYIELPESAFRCSRDYREDVRQGVEIEYIPRPA